MNISINKIKNFINQIISKIYITNFINNKNFLFVTILKINFFKKIFGKRPEKYCYS